MISESPQIGWIPELDIPSAVSRIPDEQLEAFSVLVSVVDSTGHVSTLPSLIPHLRGLDCTYTVIDTDVLIEPDTLSVLMDGDFLSGFDEIWLCSQTPKSGKPQELRITSDAPLRDPPLGLIDWMLESSCQAGLGDGDGLNFVTFDPSWASLWKA